MTFSDSTLTSSKNTSVVSERRDPTFSYEIRWNESEFNEESYRTS